MKRTAKIILAFLVAMLLAYGISFLITNYRTLRSQDQGLIEDIEYATSIEIEPSENVDATTSRGRLVLNFNNAGRYLNKLIFNYDTEQAFKWLIQYNYVDTTGRIEEKAIEGSNSAHTQIFTERINHYPQDITLTIYDITHADQINITNLRIDNRISYFNWHYVFFIVLFLSATGIFVFRKQLIGKPERIFLALALPAGVCMALIQPLGIGRCGDDETHFERIYHVINETDSTSYQAYQDVFRSNFAKYNSEEESIAYSEKINQENFIDDNPTFRISYGSLSYIGHFIGVAIGLLLNLNFVTIIVLACLTNTVIYSLAIYFAIKKLPIGKYLLMVVGLIPLSLYLSANFSYDPTLIAFMMLGFSYFIYELLNNKEKLTPKNTLIMIGSFIIAFAAKPPYSIFMGLLLFLPKTKFHNIKSRRIFKIAVAFIILLVGSTFLINSASSGSQLSDPRGGNTSVRGQLGYVKNNPTALAKIAYNSVIQTGEKLIGEKTYHYLAYQGPTNNPNSYYLFIFLIFFAILCSSSNTAQYIKNKYKVLILIVSMFIICMIWGSMWLVFTEVGASSINGVQNRYFIPVIFPLLLLFCSNKIKFNIKDSTKFWVFSLIELIAMYNVIYSILY